jgi:Tfp pilus assembly protein PilE
VAVPQYFKVVERGRVSEVHSFVGDIKSAQERYIAKYGKYSGDLSKLDITFAGVCTTAGDCGMKFFYMSGLTTANCSSGGPGYLLNVGRTDTSAAPPATYGMYQVLYNRCLDTIAYANCGGQASPNSPCDTDF